MSRRDEALVGRGSREQSSSLAELINVPVSALAGVSEADAEALKKTFNTKTIGDLADNKYVRAANAIVEIAGIAK